VKTCNKLYLIKNGVMPTERVILFIRITNTQ